MRIKLKLLFVSAAGFIISSLFLLQPVACGQTAKVKTFPLAAGLNFAAGNFLSPGFSSRNLPEINFLMWIKKILQKSFKKLPMEY